MPCAPTLDRPEYDRYRRMTEARASRAANFARQILETTRPFLPKAPSDLAVLDIGCGYGHTAAALAGQCRDVTGIEPSGELAAEALNLATETNLPNLRFRQQSLYDLPERSAFDLVVLDNVFEHLPDQPRALQLISAGAAAGGVAYLLMPNKLWPIEVHYNLPFLSYLPLRAANWYLRASGRGRDYTDASFAPTYFRLNRLLRARSELEFQYVLPADLSLATAGDSLLYRAGAAAIRRLPCLWAISKALLVVAVKKHG